MKLASDSIRLIRFMFEYFLNRLYTIHYYTDTRYIYTYIYYIHLLYALNQLIIIIRYTRHSTVW